MSQTRTQRFAGVAMAQVRMAAEGQAGRHGRMTGEDLSNYRKKYKARAESFPAMLMQSGLTQAFGFLLGKAQIPEGKSTKVDPIAYAAYAETLAAVVRGKATQNGARELHRTAIESDLNGYRRLTREVLEAAILVRRFAQIELKDDASKETSSVNAVTSDAQAAKAHTGDTARR